MKLLNSFKVAMPLAALVAASAIALPNTAMAGGKCHRDYKGYAPKCSHSRWYATGGMGYSYLHDKSSGTGSVDQGGLGWNVGVGYLYNRYFGGELGYNHYEDSRETSGSTQVAKTSHYSLYLAATARYMLGNGFLAFAKLGPGYTYAHKLFPGGATGTSGSLSAYWGLGVAYKLTKKTYATAQWTRVVGNDYTGSADLASVGIAVKL